MTRRLMFGAVAAAALLGACGDDDGGTPDALIIYPDARIDGGGGDAPPFAGLTTVTMVVDTGFRSPTDAVVSHDGATIYFAGRTPDGAGAVFSVPFGGGSATAIHSGSPFEYPTGLVLSCDGSTLYVADPAAGDDDDGRLFSLPVTGSPSAILGTAIRAPSGLALGHDCATLYVTGRNSTGAPALFTVGSTGGIAATVKAGTPLVSPTGVHVDPANVAWVMDHLGGTGGTGALFRIMPNGDTEVVSGADLLALGAPAGVSLAGETDVAVISSRDRLTGAPQLLQIDTSDGAATTLSAALILDPAGLRSARNVPRFAIADSEGDAIFNAE